MVERAVVEDMADYMLKLNIELQKKGFSPEWITHIVALFVFHQFNGTRNDTAKIFAQIVSKIEKEMENKNDQPRREPC